MSKSGDTQWFMEQVGREQSRLRAFIGSLGIRAESVDDIAQDALLVDYELLAAFRRDEDFGAWVRGLRGGCAGATTFIGVTGQSRCSHCTTICNLPAQLR
jgi:hypothetical protein